LNKITKIDMINIDTFVKKNNFFSARRSLRLKHDDYGRNISIIMIN
jgi:copper oxidase (laccase) domain-containing protein